MCNGGMTTFKTSFFLFTIIISVIISIIIIFNFELFWNIMVHGTISGNCVWPSDYVAAGDDFSNLIWDEDLECYLEKD